MLQVYILPSGFMYTMPFFYLHMRETKTLWNNRLCDARALFRHFCIFFGKSFNHLVFNFFLDLYVTE
ncbi:hypothetical protein HanPI659440_Chr08g0288921 [Helianthus annuus]|nr:hypothetical protein HanPI659440_Chr08g0288921 [Helianthus annuus]